MSYDASNRAGANGYPLYVVGTSDTYGMVVTATDYDCCVACQTYEGGCGGAAFFGFDGGQCYIDLPPGGTCDPNYNQGIVFDIDEWDTGTTITAGPCGQGAWSGNYIG